MKTCFYIGHINNIGGVESWIYYIAQLYGRNRDITLYYSELADGAEPQLERLKPLIKIRRYYGQIVKCDTAIFCYDISPINSFIAKEKLYFVHGVFSKYGYKKFDLPEGITRVVAVSKTAGDDFEKLSGRKCEIMYNPLYIEKPKKVLRLISATRISEDKGSIWEKMQIFAKKLENSNIPYIWFVFTNSKIKSNNKNIIFMSPELSITNYIADADYLVQLSKSEAYAYSVIESLTIGTPVIITNFDAAIEMGVKDGENGYILNMEMDNIDIDKIYNHIPKFVYEPKNSDKEWKELLGKETKVEPDKLIKVKCVHRDGFTDNTTGKFRKYKDTWYCDKERALELYNFTDCHLIDIID